MLCSPALGHGEQRDTGNVQSPGRKARLYWESRGAAPLSACRSLSPQDFPGGPLVKTPRFHCSRRRFNPWLRKLRSLMPRGSAKKPTKQKLEASPSFDRIPHQPSDCFSAGEALFSIPTTLCSSLKTQDLFCGMAIIISSRPQGKLPRLALGSCPSGQGSDCTLLPVYTLPPPPSPAPPSPPRDKP